MPDALDHLAYRELRYDAPDQDALAAFSLSDALDQPPADPPPVRLHKGRGAVTNPAVRFDARSTDPFDDGWNSLTALPDLPPLPTTLEKDQSRSVISWNTSPDLGFDRAVNPYRGCEHGCIYCYARPTHAYLGYSPGLEFETRLRYKPDVAALLEQELGKKGYIARPIALGSNTDPYQPVERTLQLTRAVLDVLDRHNHPVSIVTKSAGVLRDLDVLRRMADRKLARVWLSVTTLDADLARKMEPRAATPARRLQAIQQLAEAGIPVGVMAAPMIPGLNDAEMERILQASSRAGARHAGYVLLRLPHEVRDMFIAWLNQHVPARARHVLNLIRETRSGELNEPRFGHRMAGAGPYADMLAERFSIAVKKYNLTGREQGRLDCSRFVPPINAANAQMCLF